MYDLAHALKRYSLIYPEEKTIANDFIDFLSSPGEKPFARENLSRHITGSACVLSPDSREMLLTHHLKLNLWVQLGGHCDGNSNVLESALREAEEESTILGITPIDANIFDIDKHFIPARKDEPEHFHYDVRYLLRAPHKNYKVSPESKDLAWKKIDDPFFESKEAESLHRMHFKWKKWLMTQGNA